MAAALKEATDNMESTNKKLKNMEEEFLGRLKSADIDFIRNGATDHVFGNINISIKNEEVEALLHRLDLKGIAIATGSACDSQFTAISHVIEAIGVSKDYAKGTIRVSFGADNKEDDAIKVADALIEILNKA